MKITCYGSRGSLPAPSRPEFSTVQYGGNTNCFYIEAGPFKIIEGCGSGVAVLGDVLMKEWKETGRGRTFIVLLNHFHWDHIQGLPFCVPFFLRSNTFHIHGFAPSGHEGDQPRTAVEMMLAHQQSNPHFPVAHESMPAQKVYRSHNRQFSETVCYQTLYHTGTSGISMCQPPVAMDLSDAIRMRLLLLTTIPLQHPDGCLGYRVEYMGKVVAFCYDCEPLRFPNKAISSLAKGADLLVLDGAYTDEQLRGAQQGFGHGSPESCVEQAKDAGAKRCLIHHHDPKHDDVTLQEMENRAGAHAIVSGYAGEVAFAREGAVYTL